MRKKDTLTIIPFIGVGEIKFGTPRAELRKQLKSNYKEFKRNEFSENTTDFYEKESFFVEYDKDNCCEAIELSVTDIDLIFANKNLFSFTYDTLVGYFTGISLNYSEDDFGINFFDLGFGASKSMNNDKIETVIVFSKNYWD